MRSHKEILDRADIIYTFVSQYSEYIKEKRDYGTGERISMVEVHTLTSIEENPGITNEELSAMWNRTKGAISQTVSKLEKKGHIRKEKCSSDARSMHFYATEKGEALSRAHKKYDEKELEETNALLEEQFSKEELDHFYAVLSYYNQLLRNEEK